MIDIARIILAGLLGASIGLLAWELYTRRRSRPSEGSIVIPPGYSIEAVALILRHRSGYTCGVRMDADPDDVERLDTLLIHLALRTAEHNPAEPEEP